MIFFRPLPPVLSGISLAGLVLLASFSAGPVRAQEEDFVPEPTAAQKPLPMENLRIKSQKGGVHDFRVEVARTPRQQTAGEMFRTAIPEGSGMLFPWPYPRISRMWMRNTSVPLDIVFIAPDGRVDSVAENTVPYSEVPVESHGVTGAVLELPAGSAEKYGIAIGDEITCPALKAAN